MIARSEDGAQRMDLMVEGKIWKASENRNDTWAVKKTQEGSWV